MEVRDQLQAPPFNFGKVALGTHLIGGCVQVLNLISVNEKFRDTYENKSHKFTRNLKFTIRRL
jgi:hypothetical protein